jgi:hypothetical protein
MFNYHKRVLMKKRLLHILFLICLVSSIGLAQPLLVSPNNNAGWVSTTPTLAWYYNSVTAETYRVQVTNTDGDWATSGNLVVDELVTGWSGTYNIPLSAGLEVGRKYWWRVKVEGSGNPWSSIWNFTTYTTYTVTSIPYLSAPVNGSIWETTSPTLYWWYSTASSSVLYRIDICSGDPNFGSGTVSYTVLGGPAASKALSSLNSGTTYFWRVSANGGTPSSVWKFTTQGTSPQNTNPRFTNMNLTYSNDGSTGWTSVSGNMDEGFRLSLLDVTSNWYYLTLGSGTVTNIPIKAGYYPFYLISYPTGFFTYWDGRGVNASAIAGTWQAEMWKIINGMDPLLYVYSDGAGDFSLIDGLQRNMNPASTALFRVDETYLVGNYIVSGNVIGTNDVASNPVSIKITFDDGKPYFTSLQLQRSTTAHSPATLSDNYSSWAPWSSVSGNLSSGFSLTLGTAGLGNYNSLNIVTATTNTTVADGLYGFYLDQTSLPSGFFAYWSAKGVTSASTGQAGLIWKVIHGETPMLYVKASGGNISLVDGFYYDNIGPHTEIPFRINDDYPAGDYTVTGKLSGTGNLINIVMHLNYGANAITIGIVTGQTAGSTVSVPVSMSLTGTANLTNTFIGKISYDPLKLKFKYGYSGVGTLMNAFGWNVVFYEIMPGEMQFIAYGIIPISSQGLLFNLNFQILPTAATADSPAILNAVSADFYANGDNSIFSSTNGLISFTGPTTGVSSVRGDATLDFVVDINDVVALVNHLYGITPLTGQALANAGAADGTTGVSLYDVIAIINYMVFGYWGTTPPPTPALSEATLKISDINLDENDGLIKLPISMENAQNINSLEVKFKYDPEHINYQTFSAMLQDDNKFTNAVELTPGTTQFTFASTEGMKGDFNPGKVTLHLKDGSMPVGSEISTEYSVNSGEYKSGPIYKIGTGFITGVNSSENKIPTEYRLEQNYPNPFNPSTTIYFSLPRNSVVSLKIYDMLGREVKTLLNQQMNAGIHSINWNAENEIDEKVTSGIYIYRITAGDFISAKKMILIK